MFLRCRQVVETWSEGQDRLLPLPLRMHLWLHCVLCRPCGRYVRQVDQLRRALRQIGRDDPPDQAPEEAPRLSDECRRRICKAMDEARRGA